MKFIVFETWHCISRTFGEFRILLFSFLMLLHHDTLCVPFLCAFQDSLFLLGPSIMSSRLPRLQHCSGYCCALRRIIHTIPCLSHLLCSSHYFYYFIFVVVVFGFNYFYLYSVSLPVSLIIISSFKLSYEVFCGVKGLGWGELLPDNAL